MERTKQIEIQEQEIARKEKALDAQVKKPAEAEKYRLEKIAEAERKQAILKAEAEAEARIMKGKRSCSNITSMHIIRFIHAKYAISLILQTIFE